MEYSLLVECSLDQPGNDREVPALIVGGKDHRVLVLGVCHFVLYSYISKLNERLLLH